MTARTPKPKAVLIDRDGTTFSIEHHKDAAGEIACWHCYNGLAQFDPPIEGVWALIDSLNSALVRIMTSGREEAMRRQFVWGMEKHGKHVTYLFMRADGDTRPDSVVKREMYLEQIEPYFDVQFAIDDRPQVVETWRSLGIPVLHVRDPGILPRLVSD
jgi:hypothetical protein